MRTGPFSSEKVVALLNAYYVPVYVSNEDFRGDGPAPAEERKELQRIFAEGYKAKLSVGTVHAYVLSPEGGTVTVRMIPGATVTGRLVDADGKPRAGVELETRFRRKGESYWAEFSEERVKTDRDGRFHIEALIPDFEYQMRDEKVAVQFGDGLRRPPGCPQRRTQVPVSSTIIRLQMNRLLELSDRLRQTAGVVPYNA